MTIEFLKLRHCRSQARMRKEEGTRGQQHDTTYLQRHWTQHTREGVSWEGSVSTRGMREVTYGADASCSPPTVVAERTLPAAGLSPSGWPSREPYRKASPSGGPAGRTRWNGFSEPSSAWGRGVEQKHQGTLSRFLDAVWVKRVWMRGAP